LQKCLDEIKSLQKVEEPVTTEIDIEILTNFTRNFHDQLRDFKLSPSWNPDAIVARDQKYLPPNSLVLPGRTISRIISWGVKPQDEVTVSCYYNMVNMVKEAFDKALMDQANLVKKTQNTDLEEWAATFNRMMGFWSSGDTLREQ
jgi:hypothetical protein